VYAVPASAPITQLVSEGPAVQAAGPGEAAARYPVMVVPFEAGADQDTLIDE
jgi:hypothetical protein